MYRVCGGRAWRGEYNITRENTVWSASALSAGKPEERTLQKSRYPDRMRYAPLHNTDSLYKGCRRFPRSADGNAPPYSIYCIHTYNNICRYVIIRVYNILYIQYTYIWYLLPIVTYNLHVGYIHPPS